MSSVPAEKMPAWHVAVLRRQSGLARVERSGCAAAIKLVGVKPRLNTRGQDHDAPHTESQASRVAANSAVRVDPGHVD
jgi:hypothetical protein